MTRVLDIATGIGEQAVTSARKVKPNGKVVATDISAQMLAPARTRAKSLGLESIWSLEKAMQRNWICLNQ